MFELHLKDAMRAWMHLPWELQTLTQHGVVYFEVQSIENCKPQLKTLMQTLINKNFTIMVLTLD